MNKIILLVMIGILAAELFLANLTFTQDASTSNIINNTGKKIENNSISSITNIISAKSAVNPIAEITIKPKEKSAGNSAAESTSANNNIAVKSSLTSFSTLGACSPPALVSPLNNAVVSSAPKLDWQDVPGAISYGMRLYAPAGISDFGTYSSEYNLTENGIILAPGIYSWAVNVRTSSCTSDLSSPWTFTISAGCSNECSYDGQKECYSNDVRTCVNQNGCLKWSYSDCGDSYCQGWQGNYCSNGNVAHDRICYSKGCSSSKCFASQNTETAVVEICAYGCENGQCKSAVQDCTVTGCLSGFTCCNKQCMPSSSSSCTDVAEKQKTEASIEKIQDAMYNEGYYYKVRIKYLGGIEEEYKGWWEDEKFYYESYNTVYELNYHQNAVAFVKTSEKREAELDGAIFEAYDPNAVSFNCLQDYYIKLENNPICAPLYLSACQNTNFSDPDISKRLGFLPVFAACSLTDAGISYGQANEMAQEKYKEIRDIGNGVRTSSVSQTSAPDCDSKFLIENLNVESIKNEVKFDFDIINIGDCSIKTFWGVFGGANGTNSMGIADLNANSSARISTSINYSIKGMHLPLIALDKIDEDGDRGVDVYKAVSTDTSECPYACCSNSIGYVDKSCSRGYKCLNNKCLPYA